MAPAIFSDPLNQEPARTDRAMGGLEVGRLPWARIITHFCSIIEGTEQGPYTNIFRSSSARSGGIPLAIVGPNVMINTCHCDRRKWSKWEGEREKEGGPPPARQSNQRLKRRVPPAVRQAAHAFSEIERWGARVPKAPSYLSCSSQKYLNMSRHGDMELGGEF